ncbi:MAG TPA: purine-nucleoside phosphorylase [Pyrinomonadaceae bacterium]|nr:purine-nucleoside phosphorylase [Pyrinomonadaceae bacterium]
MAAEAAEFIRDRGGTDPKVAVVLGSGLGAFADDIQDAASIPYQDIPHFVRSTVEGHAGRMVVGKIGEKPIAVQQGRFHYYEGYSMEQVIFPMRVFRQLGVEVVILTNAAGSLKSEMPPGQLMLITDHINMMGVNPLRGPNDERFGPRFPDMSSTYDSSLQDTISDEAEAIARERKIDNIIHRGIYCALSGPTYETPAEIRLYRLLGADAVGMSTVPEAIAARHSGMRVAGISCITNYAAGMTEEPIDHSEVMETGERVGEIFKELLSRTIGAIGN